MCCPVSGTEIVEKFFYLQSYFWFAGSAYSGIGVLDYKSEVATVLRAKPPFWESGRRVHEAGLWIAFAHGAARSGGHAPQIDRFVLFKATPAARRSRTLRLHLSTRSLNAQQPSRGSD